MLGSGSRNAAGNMKLNSKDCNCLEDKNRHDCKVRGHRESVPEYFEAVVAEVKVGLVCMGAELRRVSELRAESNPSCC